MRVHVNTYTQFEWQVLENKNIFSEFETGLQV
jgi:hypothetical protein